MQRLIRAVRVIGLMLTAAGPRALMAQSPAPDSADVNSIEGIVRAYYEVISGPAGTPRQWRRDSTLYMPAATFVAMDVKDGTPIASVMTPEEFRQRTNASFVKNGFFETEIGSRIERFGNVAQVRSAYETRQVYGGPITGRGVNYLMVYWDGRRWWIAGAVWDDEREGTVLPEAWVGRFEREG